MIEYYFQQIICAKLNDWHKKNKTTFEYQPSYPENTTEYFIEKICYHNYQGWHYEDLGQQSDPEKIIRGWRGSQINNRNRNQTVQSLDHLFSQHNQADAECHTESLAVILDKVSILYLKYLHLFNLDLEKAKLLFATVQLLINCTQKLYDDILAGRKRSILFPHAKLYDEVAT